MEFALRRWSLRSRPLLRVRNVFRKRKTPRPRGKATRYEWKWVEDPLPTASSCDYRLPEFSGESDMLRLALLSSLPVVIRVTNGRPYDFIISP